MLSSQISEPHRGLDEATSLRTKIGPYRLEAEIGGGGMGDVYRAVDERLDREVAIKHLSAPMAQQVTERERFWLEARSVARLNHPAIVQVFDIVEDQHGGWLVMEWIQGRTLADLLEKGPLGVAMALRLFTEISEGLAEAHDKGILHRDLKPENVMVTTIGHAKLLDFGLAHRLGPSEDEESLEGILVGTPCSMSPEQARSLALDCRSDLFSLGTLLYEVLTGVKPFRGTNIKSTLQQVCFARQCPAHELNPRVPEELARLIDRLLEKQSDERPRDALEVARALRLIWPGGKPS